MNVFKDVIVTVAYNKLGAFILGTQTAFSTVKTLPGLKRAHIERMNGTPADSRRYCTKQDAGAIEWGQLPKQGKRNDLHFVVERIMAGESIRSLATKDLEGATAIVKFSKGLQILRSFNSVGRVGPPIVFWLHGGTGTGKTRWAIETAIAAGGEECFWISSCGLQWFDGYDGQPFAIFDDFRSKHAKDFAWLLRLLDRYPLQVPFKGGFVRWAPQFIFITCPKAPETEFESRKFHRPEDLGQLTRRLSHVLEFPRDAGKASEYFRQSQVVRQDGVGGGVGFLEGGDNRSLQLRLDNPAEPISELGRQVVRNVGGDIVGRSGEPEPLGERASYKEHEQAVRGSGGGGRSSVVDDEFKLNGGDGLGQRLTWSSEDSDLERFNSSEEELSIESFLNK